MFRSCNIIKNSNEWSLLATLYNSKIKEADVVNDCFSSLKLFLIAQKSIINVNFNVIIAL